MSEQDEIDWEAEAKADAEIVKVEGLGRLRDRIDELQELEAAAAELAAKLAAVAARINAYKNNLLPTLMRSVGQEEFKTLDGRKVKLSTFLKAKVVEGRETEAYKWLEENGYPDVVKFYIKADFDKGKREDAEMALTSISNYNPLLAVLEEKVHPQTLEASLREYSKRPEANIPDELFQVFTGDVVKVSDPPKPRRSKADAP